MAWANLLNKLNIGVEVRIIRRAQGAHDLAIDAPARFLADGLGKEHFEEIAVGRVSVVALDPIGDALEHRDLHQAPRVSVPAAPLPPACAR